VVKRFCERDCVGVSCQGDPPIRALTIASQAQRLLFMVEVGPSTYEWSVIFRKQKFQLLPSYAEVRMQKLGLPPFVREAPALDPEPEMLEIARRNASSRPFQN
jgi:hypothetical protein